MSSPPARDPTLRPPPAYTVERANAVYGEAFRRAIEYIKGARVAGDVLEFGTLRGYTARWLATLMAELDVAGDLWLFDSFAGLPEHHSAIDRESYEVAENRVWRPGSMAPEPDVEDQIRRALATILAESRIHVVKGYFEETVDRELKSQRVALVHIDCDLYASTRFVLDRLIARDLFQDGCLLFFDDYNTNRASPWMGERRAMAEVFGAQHRFEVSPWFSYGWHGQGFFVHDRRVAERFDPPGGSS